MNEDQLGELAYNTYCEARSWTSVGGQQLPHWRQQEEELRKAWIRAAKAVASQIATETGQG